MSGPKAYTMKEMKGILDYLVEHKAYSEIRGRKMWMDFANSSSTNRTWQSLKETFLKRILPDVQNPYYQLTRDQVCSFKQGTDVEAKEKKNRLEIQPVGESSNADNLRDNEKPSTNAENTETHNEEENPAGEEIKSEKNPLRNRSSADTYIIEEDNVSISSDEDPEISRETTEQLLGEFDDRKRKSMKECLAYEYSEPPSVVAEVIQDFETESENSDKEIRMQDVSQDVNTDANRDSSNQEVIIVEDNVEYIEDAKIVVEGGKEVEIGPTFDHEIITEVSSNDLQSLNLNWLKDCAQEEHEIQTENNVEAAEMIVEAENVETVINVSAEVNADAVLNVNAEVCKNTDVQLNVDSEITTDLTANADGEITAETANNAEVDKIAEKTNGDGRDNESNQADFTANAGGEITAETANNAEIDKIAEKTNGDGRENESNQATETIVIDDSENISETLKERDIKKSLNGNKNNENSLSTTADTIIPNNQEMLNAETNTSQIKPNETQIKTTPKEVLNRKRSSSPDNTINKKKKLDNGIEKTNGNAIEVTPPSSNNTEALFDALKKTDDNHDKSATLQDAQDINESPQNKNPCLKSVSLFEEQFNTTKYTDSEDDTPLPKNLVKKRVDVEVKTVLESKDPKINQKHKETMDLSDTETKPKNIKSNSDFNKALQSVEKGKERPKNIIVLKSNSDSDEVQQSVEKGKERFKHLAQAFGFVPGTSVTAAHRRRSLRTRNRTKSQRNSCLLESSDWEGSISEPELAEGYISPPRGRRYRNARRYKKPQPGRIMSLDEEGGLFVVHGNKVIPLVKNGKTLTFVTYDALGCSEDEEESIWRQKYIDEKKKTVLLQRQLDQATAALSRPKSQVIPVTCQPQSSGQLDQATAALSRSKSPILPVTCQPQSSRSTSNTDVEKTTQMPMEINMSNKQMNIKEIGDNGKIQITLTKQNAEAINLEGHWPQVLPIVQQVMSIFYKSADAVDTKVQEKAVQKEDISGLTTPIIPVIDLAAREVDEIESEIFKEIEERDNEEKTAIKRKAGRPKKTLSTDQSEKAAKRPRRSKNSEQKDKVESEDKPQKTDPENVEEKRIVTTRSSKPADQSSEDSAAEKVKFTKEKGKSAKEEVQSTKNKMESTKEKVEPTKTTAESFKEKDESTKMNAELTKEKVESTKEKKEAKDSGSESVKIGPILPRVTRSRKSGNETDSSTKSVTTRMSTKPMVDDDNIRYMLPPEPKSRRSSGKSTPVKARSMNPHEISQDRSRNSVDSTQGYQDSDATPAKVNTIKRKRKVSITVRKGKQVRRKSFSTIQNMSLDSSTSSYFVPRKTKSHSTLDSAIYKTESYQILMENRKISIEKLDVIDETNKSDELRHFNSVSKESSDNSNIIVEVCSSSNVSLPVSPELSIVENLSISRDMIKADNHPTLNEMQTDSMVTSLYNKYLIADVDVSVPLMQQDFELLSAQREEPAKKKSKQPKSPIKISGLLDKVSANMNMNQSLSDTLDKRLRDLLLESAKKITDTNKENLMDVDESQVVPPKAKGKREKKRCSTPRKRSSNIKAKANVGPVIDEHMESCSQGGRKSCPPLISFIPTNENAKSSCDVQLTTNKPEPKIKVKKDIIKVKIQRPKSARLIKKAEEESAKLSSNSRVSVYTDSGINETASISGVFLQDSVELIHNHSETCLQVNECIADTSSLEFVENSRSESVISLNSTTSLENELLKVMEDVDKLSGVHCNVKDVTDEKYSEDIYGTPTDTIYHSPVASNCSLITEDLSDGSSEPPTKWYLLSEDDTNTNILRPEQMTSNSRVSNFSANLKQLFPIACAVPDLSTISEMSKENDSKKDIDCDSRSSDILSSN